MKVTIIMGSDSDRSIMNHTAEKLTELGITFSSRVLSAHRNPEEVAQYVKTAEERGCLIFICAAGMAAHLAGAVAARTDKPVIGVPMPGGIMDGLDALLSTVQMPKGVPVATVAVGKAGAINAAVLASQILALTE